MKRFLPVLLTLLILLHVIGIFAPTSARADEKTARANITIVFDDSAVRQFLDLVAAKDDSDASLDKWLEHPANRNILRVGEAEGSLTREQFKANAKAVISGNVPRNTQQRGDIGRLVISNLDDYRKMLTDLEQSSGARAQQVVSRVSAFCPEEIRKQEIKQTVYLHMGGNWDALNVNGDIYINIHFWHDYYKPSWDGLNMIVAHELMHTVQNRAYGNPEAQDEGTGAFLSALSKIQREGTARYVETDTDATPYTPYSYGFYYRAVDAEGLRSFPERLALLEPLYAACLPTFDKTKFIQTYAEGMDSGGPYYEIGHGVAKAIDEKQGRKALLETVDKGPKEFFTRYIKLCEKDKTLPRLPDAVAKAVKEMAEKL